MKKTKPATEIELCDICQRETALLDTCPVCKSRYCLTCRAIIPGCIHTVEVCRKCGHKDDVLAVVMAHAPIIQAAIRARNNEISKLNPNPESAPG
jgi:hypothetical protein